METKSIFQKNTSVLLLDCFKVLKDEKLERFWWGRLTEVAFVVLLIFGVLFTLLIAQATSYGFLILIAGTLISLGIIKLLKSALLFVTGIK